MQRVSMVSVMLFFLSLAVAVTPLAAHGQQSCGTAGADPSTCIPTGTNASPAAQQQSCGTPGANPDTCIPTGGSGSASGVSPIKPNCNELINNPLFKASSANLKTLDDAACVAYNDLLAKYHPPTNGCSPTDATGITDINPKFAEDLDAFLKAAPQGIYIYSGYRPANCDPESYGANPSLNPHEQGLAADIIYPDAPSSKTTCDGARGSPDYQAVEQLSRASTYQVRLYNEDGHSYMRGECNHIELANRSGILSGRPYTTIAPPNPGDITANQAEGVSCKRSGSVINCNPTPTYGTVGSGFGGLFGSNSNMSSMFQLMMGMQIGQALGGLFTNLFHGSSNTGGSASTLSSGAVTQPAQTTATAPSATTDTSASSIDQLLGQLSSTSTSSSGSEESATTSTSSVSVSTDQVGSLQEATYVFPPHTFVLPLWGVAPLTVFAHFESGSSCSDAYDLDWGDGSSHAAMAYQPPSDGSACTAIALINDLTHTYSDPGTYDVTLLQGAMLTAVSTSSITVVATSSDLSGIPGTIFVRLDDASGSLIEASSGQASIFSDAFLSLRDSFESIVQYIWSLLIHGPAASTAEPSQESAASSS